jgi:hypothetical protein
MVEKQGIDWEDQLHGMIFEVIEHMEDPRNDKEAHAAVKKFIRLILAANHIGRIDLKEFLK